MKPQITQFYTDDGPAVILRAKPEACPERSEGTNKTLHFVQGDTSCQIPYGACPESGKKTRFFPFAALMVRMTREGFGMTFL